MADELRVAVELAADAKTIYDAWLSSRAHTKMTGGAAEIDARVSGRHTAWDGYISGTLLELVPHERIVQSWRTTEFPEDVTDSILTLKFVPISGGTRLELEHVEIPDGQGPRYDQGWVEFYFKPMQKHFGALGRPKITKEKTKVEKPAAKKKAAPKKKKAAPKKKAAAKKPAAKKKAAPKRKAAPKKKAAAKKKKAAPKKKAAAKK